MSKSVSKESFFKAYKDELRKVSYPTRQETMRAAFVTILMVLFMAITLAVFDVLFDRLMMWVM